MLGINWSIKRTILPPKLPLMESKYHHSPHIVDTQLLWANLFLYASRGPHRFLQNDHYGELFALAVLIYETSVDMCYALLVTQDGARMTAESINEDLCCRLVDHGAWPHDCIYYGAFLWGFIWWRKLDKSTAMVDQMQDLHGT